MVSIIRQFKCSIPIVITRTEQHPRILLLVGDLGVDRLASDLLVGTAGAVGDLLGGVAVHRVTGLLGAKVEC